MTTPSNMIAVIDDNPSGLRSIGRLLAVHGFCTSLYASAEEFLAEPIAASAAVVLIDINLGNGMSGVQLAREIRQASPETPIILMSASARSLASAYTEHTAGVTVLEKPFSIEVLLETIKISLLS